MMETSTSKMSTQAKLSQIKNPQNVQNSNQPLKFRSFDAFYQYYSKKQTYESSQRRNSVTQVPITNTTLKEKKESSKNDTRPTHMKNKPTFTLTTEDYNIKGRVKRLCEIFQKAKKDINTRVNLEKVITKNKTTKASKSPISNSSSSPSSCSNVVTYLELNTPRSRESSTNAVQTDLKHKNGVEQVLCEQKCLLTDVKYTMNTTGSSNNNNTNNTDVNTSNNVTKNPKVVESVLDTASGETKFNTQLGTEDQGNMLEESLLLEKNQTSDSLSTASSFNRETSVNNSNNNNSSQVPTMDELTNMLATHRISPHSNYYKSESEGGFFDSSRSDNNALVDDILNRFMNDPEFCETFFSKLENMNIYNQAGALHFSKVIDELLFLVENENNTEESSKEVTQDHRKDFEWFFNQPQVFNFNTTDRTDVVSRSTSSQHMDQKPSLEKMEVKEVDSYSSTEQVVEMNDNDQMADMVNTDNNNSNNTDDGLNTITTTNTTNSNTNNTDNDYNDYNTDDVVKNEVNEVNKVEPEVEVDFEVKPELQEELEPELSQGNNNKNKNQMMGSRVLQPTNPMIMEYDLYNEAGDGFNELTPDHSSNFGDDSPFHFEEETDPDIAKYFDWVKNQ